MKISLKCPNCSEKGCYTILSLEPVFVCKCGGLIQVKLGITVLSVEKYTKTEVVTNYLSLGGERFD